MQRGRGGGETASLGSWASLGTLDEGAGRASQGLREAEEAGLIQGRREEEGREKQGDGRA